MVVSREIFHEHDDVNTFYKIIKNNANSPSHENDFFHDS